MSRWFTALRYTVLALAACAFFIFAPAGRPQDNTLNYARMHIDGLKEFDLTELAAEPPYALFPQVPQTDLGFIHNLKQRRVICVLPGEELHVFEAITTRTLDSLVADHVKLVRKSLERINTLAGDRDELASQMDERARLLDDMLGALRWRGVETPESQARDWCRAAAALALEQANDERELARLDVYGMWLSIQYYVLQHGLSAVLNTAATSEDLSLLSYCAPEIVNRQLIELLTGETEDIAARLQELADELASLHLRELRLVTEVLGFNEGTDANTALESIANGDADAISAVVENPGRFSELIEVQKALSRIALQQDALEELQAETDKLLGQITRHGVHHSALGRFHVSPREFDVSRLSQAQHELLSNAEQWEIGQWSVFLKSLAASFGTAGGRATSIPPPEGVFTGPKRIRLTPNEVPAFLAAASRLPSNDYDRIAEILDLAASEHASAKDEGSEEATFWEFISYFLQDMARRGFASAD